MKREEILKLIEEKEAKDLVFKTRGEEKAKKTEEIFHIIKQDVMDKVVEHCIECGYRVKSYDIELFMYDSILENPAFIANKSNCVVVFESVDFGRIKQLEDNSELSEFLDSYNSGLLLSDIITLLRLHGFEWQGFRRYTITKEKLLSFSEIISSEVYQPKNIKTIKNPLYDDYVRDAKLVTNLEKDNTLTYQVLGVIAFFIILFIWKFCF